MNINRKLLKKLHYLLCCCSILAVLIATLYPFNFSGVNEFSWRYFLLSFNNSSSFQDQVNNILLFMPLGFSLAIISQSRIRKITLQIILVILASLALSLTVEILQIFLPSRMPTPADLFNNTLGGFFGFISFYIYHVRSLRLTVNKIATSRASKSNQHILGCFIAYILFSLLLSLLWQSTTNLSNWDVNYPLVIGNERTGDRAWQGYISEIYIADQAIASHQIEQVLSNSSYLENLGNDLLAHYQFQGQCCYSDQTGKSPQLVSTVKSIDQHTNAGVLLSADYWLQTSAPVTELNKKISQTSEFTLSTIIATANTKQYGPARIISVSDNSLRRNFTLSQQDDLLDLRLRTPITGENGSEIQLHIPHIFDDTQWHHLVITYAGGNLRIYIDHLQNAYSFNLLELLPKEQRFFYYAIIFIPLGIGLTILTILSSQKVVFSKLIYSGILIPSLILEGILVLESSKHFSLKSLLLGIILTTGTMLLLRIRASHGNLRF